MDVTDAKFPLETAVVCQYTLYLELGGFSLIHRLHEVFAKP